MDVTFHILGNNLPEKKMGLTFNKWSCSIGQPRAYRKSRSKEPSPQRLASTKGGERKTATTCSQTLFTKSKGTDEGEKAEEVAEETHFTWSPGAR